MSVEPDQTNVGECPACAATPRRVWRPGGAFQQRTECDCGRRTRWVMCGHDAIAEATDAEKA